MQAASGAAPALTSSDVSQTPSAAQPTAKPIPALPELEDVLFDLLSSGGIDPNLTHDKLEAIQSFLHEHARDRKTHEQFVQFFERESLSMQPERPNLLALPLIDARSRSARAPLLLDSTPSPVRAEALDPLAAAAVPALEPLAPAAAVSSKTPAPRGASGWLWALGFSAIAGLMALGVGAVIELRSELQQLRAEATHAALELEQLRSETERLRAQVQEQSQAVARSEQKAQLLLQTLASPLVDAGRMENSR